MKMCPGGAGTPRDRPTLGVDMEKITSETVKPEDVPEHEKQLRAEDELGRLRQQLWFANIGANSDAASLAAAEAAIERVKGIHHRSMFPATSGEHRGKHYCPACTYTDDSWTAYAVWPCATAAAVEAPGSES
jgi:hypothetical protein